MKDFRLLFGIMVNMFWCFLDFCVVERDKDLIEVWEEIIDLVLDFNNIIIWKEVFIVILF